MSTIDSPGDDAAATPPQHDHRTAHRPEDVGGISVTVVTALGDALDAEPTAVSPLYHSIDPDALDAVFTSVDQSVARFGFEHDGCAVEIRGDGEVLVTVLDD